MEAPNVVDLILYATATGDFEYTSKNSIRIYKTEYTEEGIPYIVSIDVKWEVNK